MGRRCGGRRAEDGEVEWRARVLGWRSTDMKGVLVGPPFHFFRLGRRAVERECDAMVAVRDVR